MEQKYCLFRHNSMRLMLNVISDLYLINCQKYLNRKTKTVDDGNGFLSSTRQNLPVSIQGTVVYGDHARSVGLACLSFVSKGAFINYIAELKLNTLQNDQPVPTFV
ncbi:hypothetical protein T03_9660 [Trichinella britovi]|uniref:Uncharacterized protein n=1 Tax=Trichinella britovi TaxID=45882 RepID=A0A0V1DGP8_TRIBR|nr:hypothetical protein T03_9660 [Trichinella britovi]